MKMLVTAFALLASSVTYANTVHCTAIDTEGDTLAVSLDTALFEGEMTKTSKGTTSTSYLMRIYVMNDNPGYYYYEGLAKVPMSTQDPKFFRMKYSQETRKTTLAISEIGAEKKDITVFENCTFR